MYECCVCSGALWILQSITNLYEPAHEIAVLVGLSCYKGPDEPAKMCLLARVPPKDQDEVRLTLEKEYRIATETHILHATDTLNPIPCWCCSRRCCRGRGFESRYRRNIYSIYRLWWFTFNLQSPSNQPAVIFLPHHSLHYLKSASTHWNYPQQPIGTPSRTLPRPTVHFWSDIVMAKPIFCISI